jgi:hypothetical protein
MIANRKMRNARSDLDDHARAFVPPDDGQRALTKSGDLAQAAETSTKTSPSPGPARSTSSI